MGERLIYLYFFFPHFPKHPMVRRLRHFSRQRLYFLSFLLLLLVVIAFKVRPDDPANTVKITGSNVDYAVVGKLNNEREKYRKMCNWNIPNTLSIVSRNRDLSNLETADLFQVELCESQSLEQKSSLEDAADVLLYVDDGFEDHTHCGIGCRFMRLDMALWFAYANRMSLHSIPNGRWEYTSAQVCPRRNHECYFQSLVSNPLQEWLLDERTMKMVNSFDAAKLKSNENMLSVNLWSRRSLDSFRNVHQFGSVWLRMSKLLSDKSGCWVAAQILYYLLKPNKMLETAILKEKERLNWNSSENRCIAVHVRHGWRSRFNSKIIMSDYIKSIQRFSKTKKILLITEDEEVIKDAESNFPEYQWLYTEYPRENKHDIGVAMSKGEVDSTAEALNALVNLFLSSECEYFVGRVNSTWFRLMIMLAYGKYGTMPPFDNLLEDWGHGGLRKWGFFGMCTLDELREEIATLKRTFPELVKMDISKIK